MQGMVAVGKCGAPHGVRGQIRVKSYTSDPAALGAYGSLHVGDGRKLDMAQLRLLKQDMLVVSFAGVASREAAEALAGCELFIARAAMPEPAEEEFYHADLIGLAARLPTGETLGTIRAVLNFGAGDILEIALMGGGEAALLPFTRAVVPQVNVAQGHVMVVPPGEIEVSETKGLA